MSDSWRVLLHPVSPETESKEGSAEEEDTEGRRPRRRRTPLEPTRQEVEEHELTHIPFRSWCPACVAGKAKHWPHKRHDEQLDEEEAVPSLHLDYWFMRDDSSEGSVSVIAFKEKFTRMHGAHVVKKKGVDNEVAATIIKDIEKMGLTGKIILKADQEPAIQAVAQEVKRLRKEETILEASKKYDSQSNGIAERAVQTIECQVRTMLLALERRLKSRVSVHHRILPWLVEHAADTINRFAVSSDGRTAFERVKGKRYHGEVVEFGRKIMYKIPRKPEGGSMEERWVPGVWLGKRYLSDEHLVAVEDGTVCVTSTVRIMPDSESWDIDFINKMKGVPWDPRGIEFDNGEEQKGDLVVIPADPSLEQGHPERPQVRSDYGVPRDFYVTKQHLKKHGYTASCLKCRSIRENFPTTKGHSSQCRERLREALKSDVSASGDLARVEERQNKYLARELEQQGREAEPRNSKRQKEEDESKEDSGGASSTCADPIRKRAGDSQDDDQPSPAKAPKSQPAEGARKRCREGDDEGDEERLTRGEVDESMDIAGVVDKDDDQSSVSAATDPGMPDLIELTPKSLSQKGLYIKKDKEDRGWDEKSILKRGGLEKAIAHARKWKPKTLCLEPNTDYQMKIAVALADEQRSALRDYVIITELSSRVWLDPLPKGMVKSHRAHQLAIDGPIRGRGSRIVTNSANIAERLRRNNLKGRWQGSRQDIFRVVEECKDIEEVARDQKNEAVYSTAVTGDIHEKLDEDGVFVDDISGEVLDRRRVQEARRVEIDTFKKMNVYEHVPREEARGRGKLLGLRWVDSQKGNDVKSRLVAQEFASKGDRDDIFASTPPLVASKLVISGVASQGQSGPGSKRLMVLDVKRAFLHGFIEEEIYIELPDEDKMKHQGYVGKLVKAMYGTRSAPLMWQKVVKQQMKELGFCESVVMPCLYYHPGRDMFVVVHVDDFLCSGELKDLTWLRTSLEKHYELKGEVLKPNSYVSYLGRRISWQTDGVSVEGENKYIEKMATDWNMEKCSAVSTPGTSEDKREDGGDEELPPNEASLYRRSAAMGVYMSHDRPDISFAAKEVARGMARPTKKDVIKLKRLIRYLKHSQRKVLNFRWQEEPGAIDVYSDSDWAGCVKSRKSTSGGAMMHGGHLIHHWSSTQSIVSLSSAEAELNAIVKSVMEVLGVVNVLKECLRPYKGRVFTDSSAANGIVHRQGAGKVKHLECRQLWVQDSIARGASFAQRFLESRTLETPSLITGQFLRDRDIFRSLDWRCPSFCRQCCGSCVTPRVSTSNSKEPDQELGLTTELVLGRFWEEAS